MDDSPQSLIVQIGKRVYDKGFVAANDGNISLRVNDIIYATPTGVSKGFMRVEEMVALDMEGNVIEGSTKPSSEILMHLAIYGCRDDVNAVVHAHPPAATGFAVAGIPLDKTILAEVVLRFGAVPIAEYYMPSSSELANAVAKYMKHYDALLLANHGAVTVGADIFDAYYKMETLEHYAKISLIARFLGGEQELSRREIARLKELKEAIGKKVTDVNEHYQTSSHDSDLFSLSESEQNEIIKSILGSLIDD